MLQGTQDGIDHQYQQDYNGTLRIAGKHGDRCRNDQDYYQQISKLTDKYWKRWQRAANVIQRENSWTW